MLSICFYEQCNPCARVDESHCCSSS
jgi:hypothetical protein